MNKPLCTFHNLRVIILCKIMHNLGVIILVILYEQLFDKFKSLLF